SPCPAGREPRAPTIGRLRGLGHGPRTPPQRVRLACERLAPPRIWTFLSSLRVFQQPALDEGPGVPRARRVLWEALGPRKRFAPRAEHALLVRGDQLGERIRNAGVEQPLDGREQLSRDGFAREIPDHRAQLRVDVKGEAVVDGVDTAIGAEQAV